MPSYTSALVAVASLSLGAVSASVDFTRKGFGVQHLKHKHELKESTDCEHVEEFRFKEAVIDNFSPINEQKLWEGEGQRYWLNKGKLTSYVVINPTLTLTHSLVGLYTLSLSPFFQSFGRDPVPLCSCSLVVKARRAAPA